MKKAQGLALCQNLRSCIFYASMVLAISRTTTNLSSFSTWYAS